MRISDWSSDVCSSDLVGLEGENLLQAKAPLLVPGPRQAERLVPRRKLHRARPRRLGQSDRQHLQEDAVDVVLRLLLGEPQRVHLHAVAEAAVLFLRDAVARSEEHTSELQSLMRISYAVFCLKKKTTMNLQHK